MRALSVVIALAVAAPGVAADAPRPAWQVELEQIMQHPDWIGPAVETPFWSLDGARIQYSLKRDGSQIRDLWQVAPADGTPSRIDDAALAALDGPQPAFDRARTRAVFVRDGDVFVRDLRNGTLQQLTRTPDAEAMARFGAGDRTVIWRVGNDWFVHDFALRLTTPVALIKAEKDPNAEPEADALREMQLRLIGTLARERAQLQAQRERDEALARTVPSRAALPIFIGDAVTIVDSRLSSDGRWMLLVTTPKGADAGRGGKMPKYVTESGYEDVEDVRTRVGRNMPAPQTLKLVDLHARSVIDVALDPLPGIADDPLADMRKQAKLEPLKGLRGVRVDGIEWNADGDTAAVMVRAHDNKDRWIATLQPVDAKLHPLHRLTDGTWVNDSSLSYNAYGWMPDQQTVWFVSEHSGWSHLYLQAQDGKPRALTSGMWEATDVQWSPTFDAAYFVCNRRQPGDYEVCRVDADGRQISEITSVDGVEDFVLSPDGTRLALRVSSSHTPPQLDVIGVDGSGYKQLTDTRTDAYKARQWPAPFTVQVPSKHGAGTIWGKFYRPAELQPGKRYPIVLFVHGAGYLQNVSARWPNYFREQMFHHMLVERGYLVLDLDYRGSQGYGRLWRTAIYQRMGHPELEDYLDGIDWLVGTQQGDRERVGIYGGSYGGFMTFMALFREPGAFKAGAALRPVTDWAHYNHEYTSNILNTPELDPEAYKRSSPIEFAEGLRGQLLICHGMIDDNVFYQDSIRLAQRLIELRKDGWELASYPLERHSFQHPEAWYDEYRRIYELFERTLQPER